MNAIAEMHELERLWQESPYSDKFGTLRRDSKWGERIREEVIQGIENKQRRAIEDGILFLEVNPWYFRSGYYKAIIARKLKAASLSLEQQARLRQVILSAVAGRVGPEFKEYARLAIRVADSEFLSEIERRLPTSEGDVRGRLLWLSSRCKQKRHRTGSD